MIIANDLETLLKFLPAGPVRIALGNFDGVHLGHRKLIRDLVAVCAEHKEPSIVVTFSPHPAQFFGRNQGFRKIDSPSIQQSVLRDLGVAALLELAFDEELAGMSGQEFIDGVLASLSIREIFVGEDFRFGRDRCSGLDTLTAIGHQKGFTVSAVKTLEYAGEAVSSSRLRTLIARDGDIELVSRFLERPYCLEGVVADGKKLGRTLGFPTANLDHVFQVIPKSGVYVGTLSVDDARHDVTKNLTDLPCVVNVGVRPTITDESTVSIEAHVFGPAGEHLHLYNKKVYLKFLKRLRDELRFETIDELKRQIQRDIEQAQKFNER